MGIKALAGTLAHVLPGLFAWPLRRSGVLLLVGSSLLSCTGALGTDGEKQAGAAVPNIVLIVADDQGWGDYGFMGHPEIRTPHLDELAAQGVLFRRGYVASPLCRPSLLSLATGRYAHSHGVTGNDPSLTLAAPDSDRYLALRGELIQRVDELPTLPRLLARAGYVSHQSGKWWEGGFARAGFSEGMTQGFPHPGGRHGDAGLTIGREGIAPISDFVDRAKAQSRPFFVWYAPLLPHVPHDPPARLLDPYREVTPSEFIARYYAMCEWFDETVGEIVAMLEQRGLREETLIVFLADNGWIQDPDQEGFAERSKQTVYEGGIRTPVVFSWPGTLRAADRDELVSSLDIVPTLLDLAGESIPAGLPGTSLWLGLQGGAPLADRRIFGEGFAHDIADLDRPEASLLYRYAIEQRYKLILREDGELGRYAAEHSNRDPGPQLFDLLEDPDERLNLAVQRPEVVARMRAAIEEWYPLQRMETPRLGRWNKAGSCYPLRAGAKRQLQASEARRSAVSA